MKKAQDALILQGGGALGAYEVGVVRRLKEMKDFQPAVITGVSIGAVNAAILVGARDNPMAALESIWEDFTVTAPWPVPDVVEPYLSLFGNQSLYRPRMDLAAFARWTSYYDTTPLRGALEKYIDFEALNKSPIKLAVTAANIRSGAVEVFDNHSPKQKLNPDHILASGSLPPGFPMTKVGQQYYWDGGLFDNTPLQPAIERLDPDPAVRKRLFVVKLFPSEGAVPENMFQVSDRILEMVFSSKLGHDVETAHRINEYIDVIRRIDEALDTATDQKAVQGIRKHPAFQRLQQYMALEEIVCIENKDPEIVTGPFDFSPKRIHQRIEAGYRDADLAVSGMAVRASTAVLQ